MTIRWLFMLGEFLARMFVIARMKHRIKKGDRKLALYSFLARAECGAVAPP